MRHRFAGETGPPLLLTRTGAGGATFAQFLSLLFRQFLVFTPALVQLVMLFRRKLLHALVAFDRLRPLLGRQRHPLAHALLDALLPIRRKGWIAGRQADPVLAPLGIKLVPFGLKWGENGFLFGREL